MFGFFKQDPRKKLQKQYEQLLEQSVHAQRNGKIELYGQLYEQASKINEQIEELKKKELLEKK